MDFSLSEEQHAIRDLARQIFADHATHERLLELEKSGEWYDTALWSELAKANLTALALPEEVGGGGFGPIEIGLVLEELGRHVAPVPLLATAVLGAAPIAEFGTSAQRAKWLRPVADGAGVLSAAFSELGGTVASRPRVTARRDGESWRLDGEKECVPAAHLADGILVPARTDAGVGLFALDPRGAGATLERQIVTSGEPQSRLVLDGASVPAADVIGDPQRGAEIVDWTVERALLGLASIQLGLAEAAMRRTAAYVSERKQFGRAIGTFQGVALRAADAYVDVEGMRAALQQATWRVAAGRPARAETAAAKWWAATAGMRVVHTAQHLHGGIGSDVEYPIHRFFLWAKQNELLFGGANQQLARIGAELMRDERRAAEA